eukprot:TRINITY_DN2234_c0_g1_i1.p1 TRINITY_DN2234_c0_g1~~TRINITY_DN2234_c0_g1_i1.p1  ORF type:complete len:329 (-),score=47.42 TRINITY_DN2234_c0_g1_i1:326-1252(-)
MDHLVCKVCHRKFVTSSYADLQTAERALMQHGSSHQNKRNEAFSCGICERQFLISSYQSEESARSACEQHEKNAHQQSFSCSQCQREFLISSYKSASIAERACQQHEETAHQDLEDCYTCQICDKEFRESSYANTNVAEEAYQKHRKSHQAATYYECSICHRRFEIANYKTPKAAEHAFKQHSSNAHPESESESEIESESESTITLAPPVNTPGQWISRSEFQNKGLRKSFGWFFCPCGKHWVSAHAWTKYTQGCQSCERHSLPLYLWENIDDSDFEGSDYDDDDKLSKPHDRIRCEACKAGEMCARG